MMRVVRSPQYDRDLSNIWDYIARDNPAAADRTIVAIDSKIELVADFPGLGTPCPHLAHGLRRTFWHDYLIYYRVRADIIELARVLHASRDITPNQFD